MGRDCDYEQEWPSGDDGGTVGGDYGNDGGRGNGD